MDPTVVVPACAVLCGLAGLAVPALIGRIPEPEPEPHDDAHEEAVPGLDDGRAGTEPEIVATPAPKEPYAEIAARPGLAWKSALASAAAGALVGLALGWSWPLLFWAPLVPLGVALAVIDWRTQLLPTKLIWPAYAVTLAGVLVVWLATRDTGDVTRAFWGWLMAGGLYFLLWVVYPRGLGYGDVRLSGILGIILGHLGWGEVLTGVYAGFLLGGVLGGLLSVLRVVKRKSFPFGPFMLVGALVGLLWGDPVLASLAGR
ncbi:MAG: A24 family peptidase [Nocardioidaceae bacterium]